MSAIFCSELTDATVIVGGEEYHHLRRSLRIQVGETVWLTDGKGTLARGILQNTSRDAAEIFIVERLHRPGEPPAPIELLVSPLKQPNRMEWLIEKAVELGATAVYFLPMERSVRRSIDLDRLKRVARAALKQNLRSVLPKISFLPSWEAVPWASYTHRLMGEIGTPTPLSEALPAGPAPTLWITGPEGDFTPAEIELMKAHHVQGVSLGTLRLRAETAGILFLSAIKVKWQY